MLVFTYLASMLLKVAEGSVETSFQLGYSITTILVVLFVTSIAVLSIGVALLVKDIQQGQDEDRICYKQNGKKVRLKKLPHGHFHAFLSHR